MAKDYAKQFYKSKEWNSVRNYVLMRDKYLCRNCGAPAEEVHHIKHITINNINNPDITLNPDNLVSLCRNCHQREHDIDKLKPEHNVLPKIVFDESGNAVVVPPVETR